LIRTREFASGFSKGFAATAHPPSFAPTAHGRAH
jgi:hypothetical protein